MTPLIPQVEQADTATEAAGITTVWHSHDMIQIGFMLSGRVAVEFPQGRFEVGPDGLFVIAPRHLHRIANLTEITLHAAFADLASEARHWSTAAVRGVDFSAWALASMVVPGAASLAAVAGGLVRHAALRTAESALVADGLLLQLLVEARSLPHQRITPGEGAGPSAGYPRQLLEAIRTVERTYSDPRTSVASLAARLHLSRSSLFRLFRRHLGYGAEAFLAKYRVDRARELLQRPGLGVSEIGYAVGFRDPATFSRAVRRHTGRPPSAHRGQTADRPSGP